MIELSTIETIVEEQKYELQALAEQNFCERREEKEDIHLQEMVNKE